MTFSPVRGLAALCLAGAFAANAQSNAIPLQGAVKWVGYVDDAVTLDGAVILYNASSPAEGNELWRSDGTPVGTYVLKDIYPGSAGSDPTQIVQMGGVAYFLAYGPDYPERALWRSDGTVAGTYKVANLPYRALELRVAGTQLFIHITTPGGLAIWRSDGTPAGTYQIRDQLFFFSAEFAAAGDRVLFVTAPAVYPPDFEPWVTDGTAMGTGQLADLGFGSSMPQALRGLGNYATFVATTGFGTQLWRSDGTPGGTAGIPQLPGAPGFTVSTDPRYMGPVMNGSVLFAGHDGIAGFELWRTDGTAAGTARVKDLNAAGDGAPRDFLANGNVAFFSAAVAPSSLRTVHRSDGTANGTWAMASPAPAAVPDPTVVGVGGTEVFFVAGVSPASNEAWKGGAIWSVDERLESPRKRYEVAVGAGSYRWFQATSRGLFFVPQTPNYENTLYFLPSDEIRFDSDHDGIPNSVEANEGRNPLAKDNDVFSSARLFAMQQYRDFLGREGDAGGIQFYDNLLTGGSAARPNVIESFLNSPEFLAGLPQVTRLYFAFFERIPDYDGLFFQVQQFRTGVPLTSIAQNFAASPEFTARFGAMADAQFVEFVYQSVLGRPSDAAGKQYYLDRLFDGRLTRGQMMVGFSESPEYQQRMAEETFTIAVYAGLLRRMPEGGGLAYYANLLASGVTRAEVIGGFIASPEYRARFLP